MEIILSILFLVCIWGYFKLKNRRAINHCKTHNVDWGKVNNDRIMNDLSQSQINQNIISGKYDTHMANIKNDTWEDFKRRHPHGSWN